MTTIVATPATTGEDRPEALVRDALVGAGIGSFATGSGWAIVIGGLQDKPDTCISITGYGGVDAEPKINIDYPRVQILARGKPDKAGGEDGWAMTKAIKDALHAWPGNDQLFGARILGDIFQLMIDDKRRPVFAMNFQLYIKPASVGNRIAI